tara:strand:- start:18676 stop:19116 length:441 start_codon:yes stop_codon:yes gene_type:complete
MSEDKIAKVLGLRPLSEAKDEILPEIIEETPLVIAETLENEDDTIVDIEQARGNIKNIIEQGDDALKEMIELAKQSESPRAFEVASTLMKTLLDANKDFVEMSTKKKYAKEEKTNTNNGTQQNVTNNNLILSTADLLKMIKGETDG